jgi:hypothetical protein
MLAYRIKKHFYFFIFFSNGRPFIMLCLSAFILGLYASDRGVLCRLAFAVSVRI